MTKNNHGEYGIVEDQSYSRSALSPMCTYLAKTTFDSDPAIFSADALNIVGSAFPKIIWASMSKEYDQSDVSECMMNLLNILDPIDWIAASEDGSEYVKILRKS